MPTISFHYDKSLIARITDAAEDETVQITLTLGGAGEPQTVEPVVPHGPLAKLMEAGLLAVGTVLAFHQPRTDWTASAVVTPEGKLLVEGHATPFPSPSTAATAVTGNMMDGWPLWHTPDGRALADLRREAAGD
ncbi:DUF4357 domain-containing protein [Streptomyces sp. NPDC053429]|uniref:restriction system modified-DNA reader domain-containing protein n=1 Tax=Streptomyces sp. NPDC053429 TaxID=3365702 RepID=UPI0037D1499E